MAPRGLRPFYYHGRTAHSTVFSHEFVGQGTDQEGPGFYFTSDPEDAAGYAYPDGIIIQAKLSPRKFLSSKAKPDMAIIIKLMLDAPNYENTLQNWDENTQVALKQASYMTCKYNKSLKEACLQVNYDFYRGYPEIYLKNLIDMGYDGHISDASHAQHIVMYNPKKISVLNTFTRR